MMLHYETLGEFKKQYYKDLLTLEHVKGNEINLKKLNYPNGDEDDEANFWGFELSKDGVKHLLPSRDLKGHNVDVLKSLPVLAKNTEKVSHNKIVYHLHEKIIPARPRPLKKLTFTQFADKLSSLNHSNKSHQKIMWFMALTQMLDRANFRICSPPSFGKDSVVDICRDLFSQASTIESPTIAKLEFMTSYKWLAVNEVMDISKEKWRIIEQFLLSAGAFKTEIAKQSRATLGGVKEMLDISHLSLSLLYNDIDDYKMDSSKYFDFMAKAAVIDRFPAFRFYGGYETNFDEIKNVDIPVYVKEHFDEYKDLLSTFAYYKENLFKELSGYHTDLFSDLPERWKTNVSKLLKIVDLYSESQDEFDGWCGEIRLCMNDYKAMIEYPKLVEETTKKLGEKRTAELLKGVAYQKTYIGKNKLLYSADVDVPVQDSVFW